MHTSPIDSYSPPPPPKIYEDRLRSSDAPVCRRVHDGTEIDLPARTACWPTAIVVTELELDVGPIFLTRPDPKLTRNSGPDPDRHILHDI